MPRPEHGQSVPPGAPQVVADAVFLEAEGEKLLGDDVRGLGRRDDRLHPAVSPEQRQPGRCEQARFAGGQEEAIALRAWPSSAVADSLEQRSDPGRRVELDDPVEVTRVDAEFQRAGGHDDAVARGGEGLFGAVALAGRQGCVRTGRWSPRVLAVPPRVVRPGDCSKPARPTAPPLPMRPGWTARSPRAAVAWVLGCPPQP